MSDYLDAAILRGKTIKAIRQVGDDRIEIETTRKSYAMFHSQDCCECVAIHDIKGDLQKLVGDELIVAREETASERPADAEKPEYEDESCTWTTYYFETAKHKVRIRWHGSSNGYYSESVQIAET